MEFSSSPGACETCTDYNGNKYPAKEAMTVIPVHPNCSCGLLPVIADEAMASSGKVAEALPEYTDKLLADLKASTSPAEKKEIKRILHRLGHRL